MIIIDRVIVRNIYHTYRLIDAGAVNECAHESVEPSYSRITRG
jgi:hypothetical protein